MATSEKKKPEPNDSSSSVESGADNTGLAVKRVKTSVAPGAPGASLEEAVESSVEKAVKEYGPPIAMAVLVVILAISGWAFYTSRQEMIASSQWDNINIGASNNSVSTLETTAKEAPGTFVGMTATQIAGVVELNEALGKLIRDPDKAKQEIKSAITRFEQVLSAPQSTDILKQQAKFHLAYANESLGNFDAALKFYQELAQPDGVYELLAKDGVRRCQDPEYKKFYEAYSSWKPTDGGTAPGDFLQDIMRNPGFSITPPGSLELEDGPPVVPPVEDAEKSADDGKSDRKQDESNDD